ncbi:MAG: SUMF1/EgtB/PvdO family nonheme iron enzyme [Planctomycetota bacterium]|nr:SUMF1/EgtB/PvdO family nonheme iron enzyme [Planctomycetota bacterium]
MGWTPRGEKYEQKPEYTWQNVGFSQGEDHPVVNVSWNDAVAFCEWLSRTEGTSYRLPTEAEWEYACRAGTRTRYQQGDDPEGLYEVANVADATAKAKFPKWSGVIAGHDGYVFTAPVGSYRANGFGLYDMHGNVFEWCADWYDAEYYGKSPSEDPPGAASGSYRVHRGGGWYYGASYCRAACRGRDAPYSRVVNLGFRLARTVSFASPSR